MAALKPTDRGLAAADRMADVSLFKNEYGYAFR